MNYVRVKNEVFNLIQSRVMNLIGTRLLTQEATSHMNLGAMLHVNGKLIEAEQSYLEALRLKPDDHITRTNLQKLRHLLHKKGISSSRR